MQVRSLFAAALLSVTAVAAMAQDIDPRDQHVAQSAGSLASREAVRAEVRNLRAAGQLQGVGELEKAPVTGAAVEARVAQGPLTRAQVRAELAQWRASHAVRVGELG